MLALVRREGFVGTVDVGARVRMVLEPPGPTTAAASAGGGPAALSAESRALPAPEAAACADGLQVDGVRAHAPLQEVKSTGRLRTIKEFWCLKAVCAYPKPSEAAAAVRELVMDAWGGQPQLKGFLFPQEVRVHEKVKAYCC